jgi:hypothetical protein
LEAHMIRSSVLSSVNITLLECDLEEYAKHFFAL